ncbi:hypothetical protein E2C01_013948 [Portunus trituberculatus]|uniref:Uncharacterized protein n=1 Tax=Portunus trituberculatus TaxID=210409 RepID=A0A5B7DHX6_PORTR|nr:hypothetical protein [Portunus trituberculatus]
MGHSEGVRYHPEGARGDVWMRASQRCVWAWKSGEGASPGLIMKLSIKEREEEEQTERRI